MSQTFRVIGRDLSCDIYDGGAVDGAPSYGSAIAVDTLAREVRLAVEVGEIDVSALGDATKRFRPDQSEWTIEMDLVVESIGLINIDIGDYVKVEYKAYSGFATASTYEGFMKNLEIVSREGTACIQRMTLRGPADQTVA